MIVLRLKESLRCLILFVFSVFYSAIAHEALQNIKDTHTIVKEEYRNKFSLVNGAVAWETGVIRRLYDFGQIFPKHGPDEQGRKVIVGYDNLEQTHKIVRLIHLLFYRIPNSTGATDFGETKQLNKIIKEDIVEIAKQIASILFLLEEILIYDQKLRPFDQIIQEGNIIDQEKKESAKKLYENFVTNPSSKNHYTAFTTTAIYKNMVKEEDKKIIDGLYHKLYDLQQWSTSFFAQPVLILIPKKTPFAHIALEALRECGLESLYPPNTVQMVFMAFLYKRCSHDRNAIKAFYDQLNIHIPGVLTREIGNEWVNDHFESVNQKTALDAIKGIFTQSEQEIQKQFDAVLYYTQQIRGIPTPVGYGEAVYTYEQNKQTPAFPDCMDNTIRNFINILAYNKATNTFNITLLAQRLGTTLHDNLIQFYQAFSDVNIASDQRAHNAWINVISNIPYVAYKKTPYQVTQSGEPISHHDTGYIAIPNNVSKTLSDFLINKGYTQLALEGKGYEVRPSVRNLIIVLDHLLGLHLFDDNGGLAKEFSRPDFIKYYFPLLCEKLQTKDLTGYMAMIKNATIPDENTNFDKSDYTSDPIYSTLPFSFIYEAETIEVTIEIMTSNRRHGELYLNGGQSDEENELRESIRTVLDNTQHPIIHLLGTNVLSKQQIDLGHMQNYTPQELFLNYFVMLLENTGMLSGIVDSSLSKIFKSLPLFMKIEIKNLLIRVADKQPDINIQDEYKGKVLVNVAHALTQQELLDSTLLQEAHNFAVKVSQSEHNRIVESALELFKILVERGRDFNEAIQAATNASKSQDHWVQQTVLDLLKALVEKGQAFDQATKAATDAVKSKEFVIPQKGLALFKALVEKGQTFDQATKAATDAVKSTYFKEHLSGLDLFKALVEKGRAFDQAIDPATEALKSQDDEVVKAGIILFKALVEKDLAFKSSINTTITALGSQNVGIFEAGLELFKVLFEKSQTFNDEVTKSFKPLIKKFLGIIKEVEKLRKEMEQQASNTSIEIVKAGISSIMTKNIMTKKDITLLSRIQQICHALVQQGKAFDQTLKIAQISVESENDEIKRNGLKLFRSLLKKGQAFGEAMQAVESVKNTTNKEIQKAASDLLEIINAQKLPASLNELKQQLNKLRTNLMSLQANLVKLQANLS